jgi:hypothetical protein
MKMLIAVLTALVFIFLSVIPLIKILQGGYRGYLILRERISVFIENQTISSRPFFLLMFRHHNVRVVTLNAMY